MDVKQQEEIINYMIRKNPESTIKDFIKEMKEVFEDVPTPIKIQTGTKSIITYFGKDGYSGLLDIKA